MNVRFRSVGRGLFAISIFVLALGGPAVAKSSHHKKSTDSEQTAHADWKAYTISKLGRVRTKYICFYDENSAIKKPDSILHVWTECVSQRNIYSALKKDKNGDIVKTANEKIKDSYIPPLGVFFELSADQDLSVTLLEQTADAKKMRLVRHALMALDCKSHRVKELKIAFVAHRKHRHSDTPTEWQSVPPDTVGSNLLNVVCTAHGLLGHKAPSDPDHDDKI